MAAHRSRKTIKVRVEYDEIPPQVFISELNKFIRDHQPPRGFSVEISWERVARPEEEVDLEERQARVRDLPCGYSTLHNVPVHRGPNHCPNCLCSPCIIQQPPEFLQGSCDPHPANAEKRHRLYKLFWRCLNTLGVWQDEEYLRRKELRTVRDDKRDIMPRCIVEDIRRRYPSGDGQYRDYMSTFDASIEYGTTDDDMED